MEQITDVEMPKEYREKLRRKEAEFVREMKEAEPEFVHEARVNYLIERCAEYQSRIKIARFQWSLDEKAGINIVDRLVRWSLAEVPALEQKLQRYGRELLMHLRGEEYRSDVSQEMIEIARQADILEFAEPNRAGFINCINPAHEDCNPSMLIKNGWAYCFSCGHRARDVIDFVMQLEELTFPEAVKFILGQD